jgi:hypothetical protein
VRFLLHKMAENGEIERVGRGLYTLPNNANALTTHEHR